MAKRASSDGKEYEKLAESIFKKIHAYDEGAKIERKVILDSRYGKREFDVVVTNVYPGYDISVIVECKDYVDPVDITVIEGYISKLNDFDVKQRFIIAKNSFTRPAIQKANDNAIQCFIAQEALHPEWDIDLHIPVFATQEMPDFSFRYKFTIKPKESIVSLVINGTNIRTLLEEKWNKGEISPTEGTDNEILDLPELKAPFLVDFISPTGITEAREVFNLSISAIWNRRYFKSSLAEIKKTQILQEIGKEAPNIFFDNAELSKYEEFMEEIQKEDIEASEGITLYIYATPNIRCTPLSENSVLFEKT